MLSGICVLTQVRLSISNRKKLIGNRRQQFQLDYILTYCDKKTWKFAFEHVFASSLLQQIPLLVPQNSNNFLEQKQGSTTSGEH